MDNQNSTEMPQQPVVSPPSPSHHFPVLPMVLGGIILLGLGLTGGYFLASNKTEQPTTLNQPSYVSPTETVVATSQPSPTIAISPQSQAPKTAELANTVGWKTESLDGLQVKLPATATIKPGSCEGDYQKCYLIENHDSAILSPLHITLKVKSYNGGSRRQEAAFELPLTDYTFTDKKFGTNDGLEGINNCKITVCISLREIIIVVDNKLIRITDAKYKSGSSTTLESTITNSIIASITK